MAQKIAPTMIKYFGWNRLDIADHEHHHHGDKAARREQNPGPRRCIAEIRLHQERQELGGRVEDRAGRPHHHETGAELARSDHPHVDHRIRPG